MKSVIWPRPSPVLKDNQISFSEREEKLGEVKLVYLIISVDPDIEEGQFYTEPSDRDPVLAGCVPQTIILHGPPVNLTGPISVQTTLIILREIVPHSVLPGTAPL